MPYVLLEHLSRAQLPVDIAETEDIHKLLSLKAAGLVVVEIPAFVRDRNGGRYVHAAKVLAVTVAGVAALRKRKT